MTLGHKGSTAVARAGLVVLDAEIAEYERPQTRADCLDGGSNAARPCPWVTCKYHLCVDNNPKTRHPKLNFPHLEPWDMPETCALDVAADGGRTLEEVGALMNITRERVRQLEEIACRKVRDKLPLDLRTLLRSDGGP